MHTKFLIAGSIAAAAGIPAFALAAPYLQLSTYSGSPGSSVTVQGYQFEPSTNVFVSLDGTSIGAPVTNGSFSTTLTVPSAAAGNNTILATSPQHVQAETQFYINTVMYYPQAQPNSWYLLPGQQLNFSGSGFAPNTEVTIAGGGGTIETMSDNSGNFSTTPVTVPYKWQNSMQTFTVSSPNTAYSIPIAIQIGTFYPNLNPSAYYIGVSQTMSASASGFAPNEPIMLLLNGALVSQINADSSGNASFPFTTPSSSGSFTLTAQGSYSGVMTSRTITLY